MKPHELTDEEIKEVIGYTDSYNVQPADRKIAQAAQKKLVQYIFSKTADGYFLTDILKNFGIGG